MTPRRLFAVYVGGSIAGAHVELHDMRFAVARAIEDAFDDLRAQWWGEPKSLHLDAWGAIEHADGYDVSVVEAPPGGQDVRLYFLNLGGYDATLFTELHENLFIVAPDARAAKARAIARVKHWLAPHKDHIAEIHEAIDVADAAGPSTYLRLTPAPARPFAFEARYTPIGKTG